MKIRPNLKNVILLSFKAFHVLRTMFSDTGVGYKISGRWSTWSKKLVNLAKLKIRIKINHKDFFINKDTGLISNSMTNQKVFL